MILIKSNKNIFNSIKRYFRYIKNMEESKIQDNIQKDDSCKSIIFEYNDNTLAFLELLSQFNQLPEIIIFGDVSKVKNRLKFFLEDSDNNAKLINHIALIDELKDYMISQ